MEPRGSSQDHGNADALNQALVDDLKKRGCLQTPRVEAAFRTVLRHLFLPNVHLEEVYSDRAISAKQNQEGQWISSSSQPAIMAIMLEQLGLEPGHKVLEIGTGPGYNAALMAQIVGESGRVVTVEIDEDLAEAAREHLALAGFEQVQVVCADGGYGYPDAAPFDRIILTVGTPDITPAWWNQMKPEGRMVLPLVLRGSMKSVAFEQVNDHLTSLSVHDCGFIPLRGDFASVLSNRIQLKPNLYLETMTELPVDGEALYSLLTGTSKDWETNVEVTPWDVLNGSLWTWLALQEPQMSKLIAEGEMVERNIVPPLLGVEGRQESAATAVLLGETGVAALMRPPGQSVPLVPSDKLFTSDSPAVQPFKLFVRQFGTDDSIVQRLLTHIRSWKTVNSLPSGRLHIRAYPKDVEYQASEGEMVVEKQWTNLVVVWPPSD